MNRESDTNMSTQLIQPLRPQRFEIRCNVGDVIVANLAVHIVFFFRRQLDARALSSAFAQALTTLPLFAGRMAAGHGRMRIRCAGQGVPFTVTSSARTLAEAIRSASADTGDWLVDPVSGPTVRWGLGPLCKVRVTQLADDATAIGFSWHHAIGDMQTAMHFMNAWAAAAAGQPVAEPLIVEDRAAYLDEHLPPDGAREPGVRCLRFAEFARSAVYMAKDARTQRTLSLYFSDDEIARMRDAYGNRMRLSANDVVCAHMSESLMNADPAVDHRRLAIAVNVRKRCGLDPMLVGNILTTLNFGPATRGACRFDRRTHPPQCRPLWRRTQRYAHQPTVADRCRCMAGRSLRIHGFQSSPVESADDELERLRCLSRPLRRHLAVLLRPVDESARCGARRPDGRGRRSWSGVSDVTAAQRVLRRIKPRGAGIPASFSAYRRGPSPSGP